MKIYEIISNQPKNEELLNYFKSDDDLIEIWPLFIQFMVYKTDGEGIEELSRIANKSLHAEDFEDEYNNAISLDTKSYKNIDSIFKDAFFEKYKGTIKEISKRSNTKSSFDLISEKLLPKNTIMIHYTNSPENIATEGFKRGYPYISMLGETVRSNLSDSVGYNFAYVYSDKNHNFQDGSFKKKGYVKFKSSGVYVYHYGDKDKQVIFWGGYVDNTDIIDWGWIE